MRDHREEIIRSSSNINKINKLLCVLCLPASGVVVIFYTTYNHSGKFL
jgi:hypothetical protein